MTLKDAGGTDVSLISADKPGFLTFTVVDDATPPVPVAGQIVSVSTGKAKATPSSVLTDASGIAQTRIEYQGELGADTIVVTALKDGSSFTATKSYVVVEPSIQLGDDSGASFISGQLELSTANLSAGGSASVRAYLVDSSNARFATPVEVSFTSDCVKKNTATIDQSATTSSGVASATYQANGCEGDDTITATVGFGGATFTASRVMTVASDTVGSIRFVSATPENITLKGAGGAGLQESSEVRFQVVGATGLPKKDQTVTFSVNGNAGSLIFSPSSAISNANGEVFTVVQAGSVPFVVNVIATVDATNISTQSTGLVISAGLPDDNSFTLSADIFNPEALRYNGEAVNVSVILSDIYNNPPPAGTAVIFTTEGGSIGSSCVTDEAGRCSVQWLSSEPRPADNRATVLAYTQGVESFSDDNGDGRLSDGETILRDLAEAFRDDDEDDTRDSGEYFADFNNNAGYDGGDGSYNGNLCNDSARCSLQTTLNISRDLVIVFSDSFANISAVSGATTLADQGANSQAALDVTTGIQDVTVNFSDTNVQPLPIGTTISVGAAEGAIVDGTSLFTQRNTNEAGSDSFSFTVKADPELTDKTSRVTITVKSPKGNETVIFFPVTLRP